MNSSLTRRGFVAGGLAGLTDLALFNHLSPVSAADVKLSPAKVKLTPDIEPLVGLIEDTPRDQLIQVVAEQIRKGVGYQQLLAGLFLAGVRGIKPRPVGFKFHAVLVVNSAHQASVAMPDSDRWLPLLWALDNYKISQAQNLKDSAGWVMAPPDEANLPAGWKAKQAFIDAMDNWDEEATDRAVTSLVRNAGASEIIELFWRYGARDFRDIGHKAIYVANCWRTLHNIGWRHAEPVMRSLAFAILQHEGANPAKRDADADRPGRENLKRLTMIRSDWQKGSIAPEATTEFLKMMRSATPAEACEQVVAYLNKGIDPSCIWDALFLTAGELLMRQPGIVGVHCVTSANALYFAYQTSGNDETRRLMMLQTAAFLPLFRAAMLGRGKMRDDLQIDTLQAVELKASGAQAIEEVFADVSKDRVSAAQKTLALVQEGKVSADALLTMARRLIFNKGDNAHDYKFCSAALEDFYNTSPAWQARYLATSMFNLRGSGHPDNGLIKRARAALSNA